MRCWEFKDRSTLEPLFGIEPLPNYARALPLEARSQVHLVDLVIHNLLGFPAAKKGKPLLDLLGVLRDKRREEEEHTEREELDELIKQVDFYLSSVAAEPETGEGDGERKEAETKELRAAIRNYQITGGGDNRNFSETDAADWIAQVYDDPAQWAFRIALAVFNGAAWETCMEAASELAACLPPPESAPAQSPPPAPPRLPNPLKLLREAGGELASAGTLRVVRLKDPQLARAVLDYVWDEYTRREVLTDWLTGLIVSRNFTKRIRAGVATGLLMLTNFDSIRRDVLYDWARAEGERALYRLAIGRALSVAAEGGRLEEVRDLLRRWTDAPDRSLRWAAARAYIFVGVRCPVGEVLAQWRAIAEAEEFSTLTVGDGNFYIELVNSLLVSLLDAMERFFIVASDTPEVRQRAFTEGLIGFKRWSDDGESAHADDGQTGRALIGHFGLLMFIKLARILLPGEAEEGSRPPILLTLIEPEGPPTPYRQCLADMFDRMLRYPSAQPTALDLLQSWLERVERNPGYEPQMRLLLSDLLARGGGEGEARRLLARHLGLWAPGSRFELRERRPDLTHMRRTVLVVDTSLSARPYWGEVQGIALEVGSALPEQYPPEVYRINSGQSRTLASLAGVEPAGPDQQTAACSLIAPVMRDLRTRGERVDALILIGNGEVFDLADWVGDPLIERWVLVRTGPDKLFGGTGAGVEEVSGGSLSAVYERLCAPASSVTARRPSPRVATGAVAQGAWRVDRSGYPLVYVEPLQRHVHLFPVTKAQFERFVADAAPAGWSDETYAEMLKMNPRVSFRAAVEADCIGLFLTAVKPEEANAFAGWLGGGYELPDERQWLACYDWLGQQPVPTPPHGLSEDALAVWQAVNARQHPRTLLELSLMPEGVREWVRTPSEKYGGLGRPARRFPTLSRDPRRRVDVSTTAARHEAYGFRLLAR